MVFYYKIRGGQCKNAHSHITLTSDDITCYVGRDKHENEYLIQYGWPGDVWFHVEGLSSAHVYFRLDCFGNKVPNPNVLNLLGKIPIDDLPEESVEDMCQIVKHNSIKGCKMASCKIVYTPHSNLKKTFAMDSGTVTYHDTKLQRHRRCDKNRKRIKELEASKSNDIALDYYAAQKENEAKIIAHKKKLKKSGGAAASMDIYDPVLNDLRGQKARANRMGDQKSGIDSGLAALEGLTFASGSSTASSYNNSGSYNNNNNNIRSNAPTTGNTSNPNQEEEEDRDSHLPIWQREANQRLDHHKDERIRFLLARGYTIEEITEVLEQDGVINVDDDKIPFSITLAKLWRKSTGESTTSDSGAGDDMEEVYQARHEEKDVLEAIYGEDDHVQFGWRTEDGEEENDDDDDDDDDDPTKPFSFDSIIPIPAYEPPERYEYPPPLLLEIYVDHGVSRYPCERNDTVETPVLAIVGGGLPFAILRSLTEKLRGAVIARSQEAEAGEPQLFDILQTASELVEEAVAQETRDIEEEVKRKTAERVKREREAAKERAAAMGITMKESTATKLTFSSEADRRAYAQSLLKQKF